MSKAWRTPRWVLGRLQQAGGGAWPAWAGFAAARDLAQAQGACRASGARSWSSGTGTRSGRRGRASTSELGGCRKGAPPCAPGRPRRPHPSTLRCSRPPAFALPAAPHSLANCSQSLLPAACPLAPRRRRRARRVPILRDSAVQLWRLKAAAALHTPLSLKPCPPRPPLAVPALHPSNRPPTPRRWNFDLDKGGVHISWFNGTETNLVRACRSCAGGRSLHGRPALGGMQGRSLPPCVSSLASFQACAAPLPTGPTPALPTLLLPHNSARSATTAWTCCPKATVSDPFYQCPPTAPLPLCAVLQLPGPARQGQPGQQAVPHLVGSGGGATALRRCGRALKKATKATLGKGAAGCEACSAASSPPCQPPVAAQRVQGGERHRAGAAHHVSRDAAPGVPGGRRFCLFVLSFFRLVYFEPPMLYFEPPILAFEQAAPGPPGAAAHLPSLALASPACAPTPGPTARPPACAPNPASNPPCASLPQVANFLKTQGVGKGDQVRPKAPCPALPRPLSCCSGLLAAAFPARGSTLPPPRPGSSSPCRTAPPGCCPLKLCTSHVHHITCVHHMCRWRSTCP